MKKPVTTAQKPVQKIQTKPVQVSVKQAPIEVKKQEQPKIAYNKETKPVNVQVQTPKAETRPQPLDNEPVKISEEKSENKKQVEEFEKQLATTEPIDAEFGKKVPVENIEENKDIKAEVVEPIQNAPAPNIPVKNQNNSTYLLFGLFAVLFVLYVFAKKDTLNKKKLALEAASKQNAAKGADDIKEFLKKRTAIKKQAETETIQEQEEVQKIQPTVQEQEETIAAYNVQEEPKVEPTVTVMTDEDDRIQAFNAYMENVQENSATFEEETTLQSLSDITEDDAVIAQLYTPIENVSGSYASYSEISELQPLENNVEPIQQTEEEIADDEVATIVSTSKLTETRGLYLAKFEGATSLVGYIQDDIYVLYNFGDVNVQDTTIESSLAQENDTDSIYIVKTGGKKLMVKSTPYDMSLEMVM